MSIGIFDPSMINAFQCEPGNPFLVSFPRTGSAWLRMMVELALDRPTLTRVYYLQDRTDWLFLHTHDADLTLERESVIYLWRAPVETVYSQLQFARRSFGEGDVVADAEAYAKHLRKWLVTETFTKKKTVITYGQMQCDPASALREIAEHCGLEADDERANAAAVLASKKAMQTSTTYDPKIVRLDPQYGSSKIAFHECYGELVLATILTAAPELEDLLACLEDRQSGEGLVY